MSVQGSDRLKRRELLELGLLIITLAPEEARATSSWGGQPHGERPFPGGWRWRELRYREAEERRRLRGEFARFGSNED